MPPKAKGAKKKNGYQMPEKFDEGFVMKDIFKNNWTLGKPIGQGGFGLIYLANKGETKLKNNEDAQYVVKIEPKDNGPLFCENHFYVNCAKEEELKVFIRANSLKHLAIPKYISSGLCTYNEKEYRFLVMDRYAKDLQSFLNQTPSHQINEIGVLFLMRQILYALEYIHLKGYSHGDIKGANIMLKNDHESYLVDYGLAYRFMRDDIHQKYQVKPERKHNGTIEYTSRDAHDGAQISRRSDLEILGYCAMHWLSGTLPWIDLIKNAEQVQQSKVKSMNNVKEFLTNCFKSVNNVSDCVKSFMEFYLNEVKKLEFESEPAYSKIHNKINDTLRLLGNTQNTVDNFRLFSVSKNPPKQTQKKTKEIDSESDNIEEINEIIEKKKPSNRKKIQNKSSSDEEEEKYEEKKQTAKPKKTPKPRITNKEVENLKIDDLSRIENDQEDQDFVEKANKKARNFLQSTAIDIDLSKIKKNLIEEENDEPKLPRNGTKTKQTPVKKNTRATALSPEPRLVEDESEKQQYGFINKLKEPMMPASNLINSNFTCNPNTPNSKLNGAQLDVLNRVKTNHAPRSPLALANLEKENNSGFMLIKKRKNVSKSDASTQTDQSYIYSLKLRLKIT